MPALLTVATAACVQGTPQTPSARKTLETVALEKKFDAAVLGTLSPSNQHWFKPALIYSPEQTSFWNPFIASVGGSAPVPVDKIHFVTKQEVPVGSMGYGVDTAGFYSDGGMWLYDEYRSSGDIVPIVYSSQSARGCELNLFPALKDGARLFTIVHENGHHYDITPDDTRTGMWINQIEAVSFELAFGEKLIKEHNKNLGLSFIARHLDSTANIEPEILSVESETFSSQDLLYSHNGIWALFASGVDSFKGLWTYVHSHNTQEVHARIREYDGARSLVYGRLKMEKLFFELAGVDVVEPGFDIGSLESLVLGPVKERKEKSMLLLLHLRIMLFIW